MSVLVLAGMIGAGKTEFSRMIGEEMGTHVFYESVDHNPVLDKFYENPKKWAFSLQVYFLNTRFKSIKEALSHDNNVLDRSIYEDALFTKVNHMQGNISDVDMDIYNDLLENMMEELEGTPKKAPDLLIYLHGSFETILSHIKKRGREFEQVSEGDELYNYFKLLWESYQEWYDNYDASPKMSISIDEYDIVERPEEKSKVMSLIIHKLEQVRSKNV